MSYTARCLKRAGLRDEVDEMHKRATSGDYHNLIAVCDEYVAMANRALGLTDDEENDEEE